MSRVQGQVRGAYPAARAAALSGVPLSTVHYWSRNEILVPSLSAERVKLWSYPDLMALRIIYWLRQSKGTANGARPDVPRSSMPAVRRANSQLRELELELWTYETGPSVAVDRSGNVHVTATPNAEGPDRQRIFDAEEFDVLVPFQAKEGTNGPDLRKPRPRLRIIPGKLGGSPHVERTRLETQALAALAKRGVERDSIYRLYPIAEPRAIDDALDLEDQLDRNLAQRKAA